MTRRRARLSGLAVIAGPGHRFYVGHDPYLAREGHEGNSMTTTLANPRVDVATIWRHCRGTG